VNDEVTQQINVTTVRRLPSRRHIGTVTDTTVGTVVHQQFTALDVTVVNCVKQWCVLIPVDKQSTIASGLQNVLRLLNIMTNLN